MEVHSGVRDYQKLAILLYPQRSLRETAEGRYWKQFRGTQTLQQVGRHMHAWFGCHVEVFKAPALTAHAVSRLGQLHTSTLPVSTRSITQSQARHGCALVIVRLKVLTQCSGDLPQPA